MVHVFGSELRTENYKAEPAVSTLHDSAFLACRLQGVVGFFLALNYKSLRKKATRILLLLHGHPLNTVDATLSPYFTASSYGINISHPGSLVS